MKAHDSPQIVVNVGSGMLVAASPIMYTYSLYIVLSNVASSQLESSKIGLIPLNE